MTAASPRGRTSTPRGLLRPVGTVAACLSIVLGCLGCSREQAPTTPQPQDARIDLFTSPNGLLYPPDLWSALTPSTAARAWRTAALRSVGTTASWPMDAATTYRRLTAEQGAEAAAWTMARALPDLAAGSTFWCDQVPGWRRAAVHSTDVDRVWRIGWASRVAGCGLPLDDRSRSFLTSRAGASDTVEAWRVRDALNGSSGSTPVPLPAGGNRLRDDSDLAPYLALRHPTGADVGGDAELLARAEAHALRDDETMLVLVDWLARTGRADRATALLARTGSRVLPDGDVLEPPDFSGSLGSTFRMLDLFSADGTLASVSPVRRSILQASIDATPTPTALHRLAAAACSTLLGRSTPSDEATTLVAAATTELAVPSGPLTTVAQTVAWAELARYAQVLGTPLPFPGLNASAVREWRSGGDSAIPVAGRVIVRAIDSGATTESVAPLVDLTRTLRRTDSMSVVPAVLAVHEATGDWLLPVAEVRQLLLRRQGGCLGGADFLRDTDQTPSTCYLETTDLAHRLASRLPA